MLPKQFRLSARQRLVHPRTIATPLFLMRVSPNTFLYSRFGFVVRKALDKRASRRNRLKRQFRSLIEQMRGQIQPGYDMLFFLKQGIMGKTREEMQEELRLTLTNSRLLTTERHVWKT